jgi:hypothetical protein
VKKALLELEVDERSEISNYVTAVLSRDPYPHVYRRIKNLEDGSAVIAVKRWRFHFRIEETKVCVFGIAHIDKKGGTT